MIRFLLLGILLFVFWLLLSGNYKAWLVISGAGAAVLVTLLSVSKRVTDGEGFPLELLPRAFKYWIWLLGQVVLSALNVTRIIVDPKLPISPQMVRVDAGPHSAVGLVTYANSITLTPGTIAVEVSERSNCIWVHALTAENAAGFAADPMNDRVRRMEGGAPALPGSP